MTSALDHVLARAAHLPFMRLVTLLEQLLVCEVGSASADERLTLAHDPALGFHAHDVTATRIDAPQDEHPRVRVLSAFAGLTGSVSPLPTSLLEEPAREEDALPLARLLLDVFHHRLLSLFYRGMRAHEAPACDPRTPARTVVLAVAGLDPATATHRTGLPEGSLLALAPLLIAHPPNAARLVAGISHALRGLPSDLRVRVHARCGVRVPLAPSARASLGVSLRLGRSSTLGQAVVCPTAAIEIEMADLTPDACTELSPGGARWPTLCATIRLLTPESVDVVLVLRPLHAPRPQLGAAHRLGRTWLGGASKPHAARFRIGHRSDALTSPSPRPPSTNDASTRRVR